MNGQVRDTLIDSYVERDQLLDLWGYPATGDDWDEWSEAMAEIPDIVLEDTEDLADDWNGRIADSWSGRDDRVAVRASDLRDRYGDRYRPISWEEED